MSLAIYIRNPSLFATPGPGISTVFMSLSGVALLLMLWARTARSIALKL